MLQIEAGTGQRTVVAVCPRKMQHHLLGFRFMFTIFCIAYLQDRFCLSVQGVILLAIYVLSSHQSIILLSFSSASAFKHKEKKQTKARSKYKQLYS